MNWKKLVIEIVAIIVVIILLITTIVSINKLRKEKIRLQNNYESILKDNALQQELTVKELKEYYSEQLEKLKEVGVKPSSIEHIVEISYNIVDSTVYKDTLIKVYDTIKELETYKFGVEAGCNYVEGYIEKDTIVINKIENNDSLLVALYQSKKCLFPKYRKYRAIVYSSCKGDTLQILNNIKVKK